MSNQKIRGLRSKLTKMLPEALVIPARKLARNIDCILGMPLSYFRKGTIVMFHVGRSGSTVLGDLLDQHPSILWDGEIFHNEANYRGLPSKTFNSYKWLLGQFNKSGRKYYGFEFKPLEDQHLSFIDKDLKEFITELKRAKVTNYILLERGNYLRRMASQYVGEKSGERHVAGSSKQDITKIKIDINAAYFGDQIRPKPLLECFQLIDEAYDLIKAEVKTENLLVLNYEEDILNDSPVIAYRKICDFIGVPYADVDIKLGRTNPFPLEDIIENFDEVSEVISKTKYSWMLTD